MTSKKLNKLTAQKLHSKGAQLREQDKHNEALQYLTLAIIGYQKEKKYGDLVDALKDKVLTWKHLFLLKNDKVFAILAKKDAESMLSVSKEYKLEDRLHTSYFRLGEIDMLFEDYSNAIKNYTRALKFYVGPLSEKGDYRYHLGEALCRKGQKKKGKEVMLKGLQEIRHGADELDPFLIHVWESGVHMRLADLLRDDEPEVARKHLEKAKEITKNDQKLVIRRRQVEKLAKTFRG